MAWTEGGGKDICYEAFDIDTAGTIVGTIDGFTFGFIAQPRLCAAP